MRKTERGSLRVYRWLLKLYPAGFRETYAAPMERAFRDDLAEAGGGFGMAILWLRLLVDLTASIPLQFAREGSQDARHALRLWTKKPWHTAFTITALAIGIGANTGVFSVIDALVLRSLPFRDPERLASLQTYLVPHDSAKQFHEWRKGNTYLSDAALFEEIDFNLSGTRRIQRVHVTQASWNFFSLLGAAPLVGRGFARDEDTAGRNNVAVIGYGLWQQLFAGNQRVAGTTIHVNGMPLTVIGVAPPGFEFPNHTAVWKAASYSRGNNGWETIGRLKPGISWPQAGEAFAADIARLSPARRPHENFHPKMDSLQNELAGPVKQASFLLMGGVVLTLLIACTNIAGLLMARNADRAGELSIRSALGASPARLVQQLLTECLLLSLVSGFAGLMVAYWVVSLAASVQPAPLASQSYSILNSHVLTFALFTSVMSTLLFGILPSCNAGRTHKFRGHGGSDGRQSRRLRDALVGAQVTLTIVLLAASISVGVAFVHLMKIDRGFNARSVVTVSVALEGTNHGERGKQLPYLEEVLDRLRHRKEVQSASATEFLPLDATGFVGGPVGFDGRTPRTASMMVPVMPSYFDSMGGRILYGREFTDSEVRNDARIAVVNEVFARQFGEPSEALGHLVTQGKDLALRIVGVAKRMDYMTQGANSSQIFVPAHSPGGFTVTFAVRVRGGAEGQVAAIRDAIRSVDLQVPVFNAKTLEERLDDAVARPKFYRTTLVFFAGFALLLAAMGIYGAVTNAVTQRTREMAVRLALGNTPTGLRLMVFGQGLLPVAAGSLAGAVGALAAGQFLDRLIDGGRAGDFWTIGLSMTFVLLLASLSIWAATQRVARLDVMDILRLE